MPPPRPSDPSAPSAWPPPAGSTCSCSHERNAVTIDAAALGLGRMALDTPTPTAGPIDGATTQTDPQTIGKDTFLKLLVAQLKYQNPMEPVDSSQFMAQTAQ